MYITFANANKLKINTHLQKSAYTECLMDIFIKTDFHLSYSLMSKIYYVNLNYSF